jgi:hypothetical protein
MKTDQTRVTETINFINNNVNVSVLRRQAVAQYCRQVYPKLSLIDFGAYNTEFHGLSGEMSVKRVVTTVPAGNAAERMKRRAIFLIWKVMNKTLQGAQAQTSAKSTAAMTMPTGNLDAALADAMLKASVCASPASAADVFQTDVLHHTRRFLATHKVFVKGLPRGADKFTNLAGADFTNVLTFHFQYDCGGDRFIFNGAADARYGASHAFQTVSVPAVAWHDVAGNGGERAPRVPADFSRILGCELTGAPFMVTTQFTGCTFCWTQHMGVIRAAHIGPTKAGYPSAALATSYPGGGPGVAQRVLDQIQQAAGGGGGAPAAMANAAGAPLRIFGRGVGNAPPLAGGNSFYPAVNLGWATIIGRNAGQWKLYMQSVSPALQITEARRIL